MRTSAHILYEIHTQVEDKRREAEKKNAGERCTKRLEPKPKAKPKASQPGNQLPS